MTKPFPWKIWIKLNASCLPGLIWFIHKDSLGAAVILATFTVLPVNLLVVVQWARDRIRGDVLAKWGGSREQRVRVASAYLILFVGTLCAYYAYLGESLGRVLLVFFSTLLTVAAAVALGSWLRSDRGSDNNKGHPDLPEVM